MTARELWAYGALRDLKGVEHDLTGTLRYVITRAEALKIELYGFLEVGPRRVHVPAVPGPYHHIIE